MLQVIMLRVAVNEAKTDSTKYKYKDCKYEYECRYLGHKYRNTENLKLSTPRVLQQLLATHVGFN